jgi:hypothetical protein
MLTISPTHSVLLREGAPGVVAWDPNQQGKRGFLFNYLNNPIGVSGQSSYLPPRNIPIPNQVITDGDYIRISEDEILLELI